MPALAPSEPFVAPTWTAPPTPADVAAWIDAIEALPREARDVLAGLDAKQLDTTYRDGGWTARQIAHHLADSHVNGYVRTRWALSEERPLIKAYDQDGWAALADAKGAEAELSLDVLDGVHARWCSLLRGLDAAALARELDHPETGVMNLATMLALYAWHGRHHLDQVRGLAQREGWGRGTRTHVHAESFDATPEQLFALLVTPSAIRGWWSAARAVVVPEPGGAWAAAWGADEDAPDYTSVATIQAFEPPRRLVLADYRYTAKSDPLPFEADFTTTFTIEPDPERAGAAVLRVEQAGFPGGPEGDSFLQGCDQGWRDTFAGIRVFLGG
ncbi:MAG: YfiT family bacillithiol transferase [Planctomycetota bacterium]